jgi:hypothetical protein
MRVDPADFRKLDLRCHTLLSDVPLHDVWAIPLHDGGPGRTMSEVRDLILRDRRRPPNVTVRALFALFRVMACPRNLDVNGLVPVQSTTCSFAWLPHHGEAAEVLRRSCMADWRRDGPGFVLAHCWAHAKRKYATSPNSGRSPVWRSAD